MDGDPSAPPTTAWEHFADGRLRRLKRGKHFEGNPAIVAHEAELAAEAAGRKALTYHDQLGKFEYLWIQFLDGKLQASKPCARCGGTELQVVQEYFLRCLSCGSLFRPHSEKITTRAGEFVSNLLVRPDGELTRELEADDRVVIQALCNFTQPVVAAHFSVTFYEGRRKVLTAGSPEMFVVPTADTVKVQLKVDAKVLKPALYYVVPSAEFVLEGSDRRIHKVRARRVAYVRVLGSGEDGASYDGWPLRWTAVSAQDDRPLPLFAGDDEPEGDELEDED